MWKRDSSQFKKPVGPREGKGSASIVVEAPVSFEDTTSVNSEASVSTTSERTLAGPSSHNTSLEPDQYIGKQCLICKKSKKGKNALPFIRVGRYRKFLICMKKHMSTNGERERIIATIESEVNYLTANGDTKRNVVELGSDEEDESSETKAECHCSGLTKLTTAASQSKCNEPCDSLIWLEEGDSKVYFCKATHLVRY
jgi:hypothetical protein